MVRLNTLNTLIDDILNEARNSNISESESLSRIQIEQWIVQYRAILIKQDIDKGRDINPDYVQELELVKLVEAGNSPSYIDNRRWTAKTDIAIPKTIDFHFGTGITAITDMTGNKIQLATEYIANMQSDRRYTSRDYIAYKKGDRLMISGPNELGHVNIRGVFENPSEAAVNFSADDLYPIPVNMLPVIKEMIFEKELKLQYPSDTTNNSTNDIQQVNNAR